jgi:hypothetical protein
LDNEQENHDTTKFIIKLGEGKFDEILTYNELSNIIEEQHQHELNDHDKMWTFFEIKDRQGPLKTKCSDYKCSSFIVLVNGTMAQKLMNPLTQ